MLRINQLAKELGVSNHDVLDAAEKQLNLKGKSHSSNLTEDQANKLRRLQGAKGAKGATKETPDSPEAAEERTPLAMHRPTAAVKIVKAPAAAIPVPAP